MSGVYVHGMAPFSRIHATAQLVSRPPEKAIPTRSPTGRLERTFDMDTSLLAAVTMGFGGPAAPCSSSPRVVRSCSHFRFQLTTIVTLGRRLDNPDAFRHDRAVAVNGARHGD